jgi:hypothetical protein
MVNLITALATAGQAIKLAQDLRGIDKAIDAAEYKLKIADLTSALSDIKMVLTDARKNWHRKTPKLKNSENNFDGQPRLSRLLASNTTRVLMAGREAKPTVPYASRNQVTYFISAELPERRFVRIAKPFLAWSTFTLMNEPRRFPPPWCIASQRVLWQVDPAQAVATRFLLDGIVRRLMLSHRR